MRKLFVFFIFLSFAKASCYNGSVCFDTITTEIYKQKFIQEIKQAMKPIGDEIKNTNKEFDAILKLTTMKYKNYSAIRAIKQEQLDEIKTINFLLNKLLKMQEIIITANNLLLKSIAK